LAILDHPFKGEANGKISMIDHLDQNLPDLVSLTAIHSPNQSPSKKTECGPIATSTSLARLECEKQVTARPGIGQEISRREIQLRAKFLKFPGKFCAFGIVV
jgi:hypothetical protein